MKRAVVAIVFLIASMPTGARAQSQRPPTGCFAYVQFQDDLPADTIRADLGYGLWLDDGTIIFPAGSNGTVAFVLPDGTQRSVKPVAFAGAGTNAGVRRKKGPGEPVKLGFAMDTLKEERWQRDKQLVEQRAKEVGAELIVDVANGDDKLQINQAENQLTRGVDVLIVAPHNGEIAAQIVEAAHRQGVPVISYDRLDVVLRLRQRVLDDV